MRNEHLNFRRTMDNTLLIANLFRSHELNVPFTENALVVPETVGFKAEAVDEEGIWRPCTVKDVSNAGGVRTTIALHHGRNEKSAHLHRDAVECRSSKCVVVL